MFSRHTVYTSYDFDPLVRMWWEINFDPLARIKIWLILSKKVIIYFDPLLCELTNFVSAMKNEFLKLEQNLFLWTEKWIKVLLERVITHWTRISRVLSQNFWTYLASGSKFINSPVFKKISPEKANATHVKIIQFWLVPVPHGPDVMPMQGLSFPLAIKQSKV